MIQKISNILEYIFVAWLIFEYDTVYSALIDMQQKYAIGLIILLLMLIFSPKRKKVNIATKDFVCYIILTTILIPYNSRTALYTLLYFGLVGLMYIYVRVSNVYQEANSGIEWLKKYSNLMIVISIISLVFWFGSNVFGNIHSNSFFPYNWNGDLTFVPSYYNIYFETQNLTFQGFDIIRNSAIFTEGPVYNLLLCFALAIELYVLKRGVIRKIILITAIITTFTTTGQLFLIITLFVYIIFSQHKRTVLVKALTIIAVPILFYFSYHLIVELMQDKTETGSYVSRSETIFQMLSTGLRNPIGGVGVMMYKNSISNSLFHVFAEGGFIMLFIYIYLYLAVPIKYYLKNKNLQWMLLYGSFFFLFTFTVAYDNCLDLMLLAYSMAFIDQYKSNYLTNYISTKKLYH